MTATRITERLPHDDQICLVRWNCFNKNIIVLQFKNSLWVVDVWPHERQQLAEDSNKDKRAAQAFVAITKFLFTER